MTPIVSVSAAIIPADPACSSATCLYIMIRENNIFNDTEKIKVKQFYKITKAFKPWRIHHEQACKLHISQNGC